MPSGHQRLHRTIIEVVIAVIQLIGAVVMGLRVRALYQNSRVILILIVAFWIGAAVVGGVRVPSMHGSLADD
ncbi:hypothetical protein SCLCIDRAFT_1212893 [Scleroderma citrinum Foug A]|uniref:Uncharacterized protein n=1 Tax=Scleroderma citrinum Foug A TaxID=1036808 RepID=A0A0C3AIS4_9AGAM|nr:hypothetical protein SCLCIDRAFT_1212893 [Scleroderma citrinum Foug A]